MMHLTKTTTSLLWRVVVFFIIFIVVSGLIGPKIIDGDILFRDGFALYGGFGKALIFGAIAFMLLMRRNTSEVTLQRWAPLQLAWIFAAAVAFGAAWSAIDRLLLGQRDLQNLALAHGGLLLGLGLAAVGCIGPKNIRVIWHAYKRVIIWSAGITAAFYLFLSAVYALWRPLAFFVLHSVDWLLGLTGLETTIIPPNTLLFDKFGVTVAEYCSGVESIALFTGLYVIVGLLDWNRIYVRRYFIVFPFALLGLYLFNILRVFGLIMAGYYINPQIAFGLFHTYAGMVLFIIYSLIFWAIAYKYLLKRDAPARQHTS